MANNLDVGPVPPVPHDWDGTPEEWARDWVGLCGTAALLDEISDMGAENAKRLERTLSTGTLVYFIQAARGEIKIGYASNPQRRLGELQMGHPDRLTLLGVVPGGRRLEAELHRAFENCRLRAEWFQPTTALLAKIEVLTGATKLKKMGWRD